MAFVTELFATGRVADVILVVMGVELAALLALRRRGSAPALPGLVFNLGAGACLVVALRFALTDAPAGWIAASLGLAFAAHVADLVRRWRAPAGDPVRLGPFAAGGRRR